MNDNGYLERMLRYCKKICKYMTGVASFDDDHVNEEKRDAVSLNLEQLGETAKKVPDAVRDHITGIEWKKIIGLRKLISHEYEGISDRIVYEILIVEIPMLLRRLEIATGVIADQSR